MIGSAFGWGASLAVGIAALAAVLAAFGRADGPGWRLFERYAEHLEVQLRFLRIRVSSTRLAAMHVIAVAVHATTALWTWSLALAFLLPATAGVVPLWLLRRREARVLALETQLASWVLALSSGLKTSPAIGDALRASVALAPAPMSEEIDLVCREISLGSSLDSALQSAASRVGSRSFSSVIATLLVARQTGGRLPHILERTAKTLREMQRLEGVVRTKTAEGKAQGFVLGLMPFFLAAVLQYMDGSWFVPFTTTTLGGCLLALAFALWIASLVAARKILDVDI